MSGRSWWLLALSLIGMALVALLAVIAYALLSDEDSESAEQVAQPTVTAMPTPPPPTPTPEPIAEPSEEDPFEPCDVEEVVLRSLGVACVYDFDIQACLTLEWADYVIKDWCPERSPEGWSTRHCDEAMSRLGFLEERCREELGAQEEALECTMAESLRELISTHCSQ